MLLRDHVADRRMADTPALLAYLPRILLYPLSGHALPALLMFTVMLWFGVQSVFGVALFAIAAPWVFHYAEGVIDQTSLGQATPPVFGGDMVFLGGGVSALRPLVGVGLIGAAWWFAREQGPGPEIAALAFGAFVFPAFMLVLTVENSMLTALNPLKLASAMTGVGRAYLAVCAMLALAAAAVALTASKAALFMSLLVAIYLWLACFHLLGYVAYHRAAQLGLRVKVAAPTDDSRRMDEQNARLDAMLKKVDEALNRKDLDGAARALLAEVGGPADVRLFHEEVFEQLQRRHCAALLHLQGQRLVGVLLQQKRAARALDIAETCFDAHKDFACAQPVHAVALAEAALQAGRDGLFERLVRDAERRYGKDPAVVTLAFHTARYWCERKRDEGKARALLKPLLAHADHPLHRQIGAYARALGER